MNTNDYETFGEYHRICIDANEDDCMYDKTKRCSHTICYYPYSLSGSAFFRTYRDEDGFRDNSDVKLTRVFEPQLDRVAEVGVESSSRSWTKRRK